jgi:dynein heavy chain, axonemal
MAPSIPSWKYFIFGGSVGSFEEGGNRTSSKYVEETYVLDVDDMKWSPIMLELTEGLTKSVKPKPR